MRGPLFVMSPSAGWLAWLSWLARGGGRPADAVAAAAFPPTARWWRVGDLAVTDLGGIAPRSEGAPPALQPCWDPAARLEAREAADFIPPAEDGPPAAGTAAAHWACYLANQTTFAAGPMPLLLGPMSGLAVVLGSGPSLAGIVKHLPRLKEAGAIVIGVNQVPDYVAPELLDYYVCLSPAARREWWERPGFARVTKVAYIGCCPSISFGPAAAIFWYGLLDGHWTNREAMRSWLLEWFQSGRTVATPALQFAARLPGVRRIALAGFDLSYPGGLQRPGQDAAGLAEFTAADLHGQPVGTDRFFFQDALRLSVMAAFLKLNGIEVVNAGGRGLLGSFRIRAADGRDLTIQPAEPASI